MTTEAHHHLCPRDNPTDPSGIYTDMRCYCDFISRVASEARYEVAAAIRSARDDVFDAEWTAGMDYAARIAEGGAR